MEATLETTNLFLGIMAIVSVLEALLIVGLAVAGFMAYRRIMEVVRSLEARHVAPTMQRVNAILDDVKSVSTTVKQETARVDQAIHSTMDRMDDTVDRVRTNVRAKTSRIIGFVRGARVALETILQSRAA
jgi:pyrimidine operon attenuation protein/uracil phosphoribosyltransferase